MGKLIGLNLVPTTGPSHNPIILNLHRFHATPKLAQIPQIWNPLVLFYILEIKRGVSIIKAFIEMAKSNLSSQIYTAPRYQWPASERGGKIILIYSLSPKTHISIKIFNLEFIQINLIVIQYNLDLYIHQI